MYMHHIESNSVLNELAYKNNKMRQIERRQNLHSFNDFFIFLNIDQTPFLGDESISELMECNNEVRATAITYQ